MPRGKPLCRLARDSAREDLPVDEYLQTTSPKFIDDSDEPPATPHIHAHHEAFEVANSAVAAAFAREDFENLADAGKPISGLGSEADPDRWVEGMMQPGNIIGVGQPALMPRTEEAELAPTMDGLRSTAQEHDLIEDFNA
ncbi:hypothetical protein GCM10025778_28100 [Paeniglutamicibacter antarcticus]|uniref:Uncharacterized protein n=1 Tax=Paeniglutamicibacter antarcticus TaxID=494023 RepID=A0ABP9TRA7_9MICC